MSSLFRSRDPTGPLSNTCVVYEVTNVDSECQNRCFSGTRFLTVTRRKNSERPDVSCFSNIIGQEFDDIS